MPAASIDFTGAISSESSNQGGAYDAKEEEDETKNLYNIMLEMQTLNQDELVTLTNDIPWSPDGRDSQRRVVFEKFKEEIRHLKGKSNSSLLMNRVDRDGEESGSSDIGVSDIGDEEENDTYKPDPVELDLLPEDAFSFFAFSRKKSTSMIVALFVIFFAGLSLSLIGYDIVSAGTPDNRLGVPNRVSPSTSVLQVLALVITVFSQTDYQDSLNTWYVGHGNQRWEERLGVTVPYWRWHFSLGIRFAVSILGLIMTFLLIMTESAATDLLLNFTAIEFVTNLDNIFFWLCAWGYLGTEAQGDAARIISASPNHIMIAKREVLKGDKRKVVNRSLEMGEKLGDETSLRMMRQKTKRPPKIPRLTTLLVLCLAVISGWFIIYWRQRTGYYVCNYVYAEFSDLIAPEYAAFNGLYELVTDGGIRNEYIEVGHGKYSKTARFAYCGAETAWTFNHAGNDGALLDICQWQVKSSDIHHQSEESYDMVGSDSEQWFIKDHHGRTLPLTNVIIQCFDCRNDPDFCGEQGTCVENRCVCDDGWHGPRCAFAASCDRIEYDPIFPPLQGNRKWAETYDLLKNREGRQVETYGRPVYFSDHLIPDVIFFNGRRWAIVSQADLNPTLVVLNSEDGGNSLADFFETEFHAFWSQYTAGFLSEEVSIDTPDGSNTPAEVSWYQAKLQAHTSVQSPDWNKPVESILICTKCSNDTNACLYDGVCIDGTCECTQGSSGRLCQIPPTRNGFCNPFFNTLEYDFDGGDCCEETCLSTLEHSCGTGTLGESFGIVTYGLVGFPNCLESQKLQGVPTLERIKKRGYLICLSSRTSSKGLALFYSNQCRAIAAAIFGNPPAFEMAYFESDRFNEMKSGSYDVNFGSDYTASRDIFEKTSESPFSFAALPSILTGMVFGGITPFPSCAEDIDYVSESCVNLKICVTGGTTFEDVLRELFPAVRIAVVPSNDELVTAIGRGLCNVIAHYPHIVEHSAVQAGGYLGDASTYEVTTKAYTKSFESWLTRPGDRVWSQFVNWVMEALVQAEEAGVVKASSYQMAKTFVFGEEFQDMFRNAVDAVGNYGDLWDSMPFPRTGLNFVNDGSSGRILSMDLGTIGDNGPPPHSDGRIEAIRARGFLRCGVVDVKGFASLDEATSTWSGMDIDLCKGIAAALFDGEAMIKPVLVSYAERFTSVEGDAVDISFYVTRTLEREVKYPGTGGTAFDFSPIYYYDGLIFVGSMPYAKCAEDLDFSAINCRATKICVAQSTTWLDAMLGSLDIPSENMLVTEDSNDSFAKHVAGECNVLAGETGSHNALMLTSLLQAGYPLNSTEYYFGTKTYTKEPLAVISRSDDSQFSDFVRWIMYGYFHAEEKGITKETFQAMPLTNLIGDTLTHMWQDSIKAVGNYGEIFERNLGGVIKREGFNLLNDNSGPQLYASPGTI